MTNLTTLSGQELPNSWQVISLRWLSSRYAGGTPDRNISEYWEEGAIPWLNSGAVNQGIIREPSTFITEEGFANSSAKWMPKGALVIALAGQGKTKAMVGYLDIETTGNQSLAAIVPQRIDGKFLYWWLTSQYLHIRNLSSQDGRDGLNLEMIGGINCPIPPAETQKSIASYLDNKVAQIDALIAKKQVLLDRLSEKRQAIITQAVTKGLNSSAPMKESGIEWLGQIPKHWQIKRLKFLGKTILGLTYSPSEIVNEGEGSLVLRSSNVQSGKLVWGDNVFVLTEIPEELRVRTGDILICSRNGSRALIGKNALITKEFEDQTFGAFMTVFRTPIYEFVHLVLNSELFSFQSGRFMTSTINQLTTSAIKDFAIPVPPAQEQKQIVDAVHVDLKKLDEVVEDVTTSIEKLTEYRAALVTAAVTGQIDGLQ